MVTEYGKGAPAAEVVARAGALVDRARLAWRRDDSAAARRLVDEAWAALAGMDAADADRLPALEAVGQRLEDLERQMAGQEAAADGAGLDRLLARLEREARRPEPDEMIDRLLDRLDEELGPMGEG